MVSLSVCLVVGWDGRKNAPAHDFGDGGLPSVVCDSCSVDDFGMEYMLDLDPYPQVADAHAMPGAERSLVLPDGSNQSTSRKAIEPLAALGQGLR